MVLLLEFLTGQLQIANLMTVNHDESLVAHLRGLKSYEI